MAYCLCAGCVLFLVLYLSDLLSFPVNKHCIMYVQSSADSSLSSTTVAMYKQTHKWGTAIYCGCRVMCCVSCCDVMCRDQYGREYGRNMEGTVYGFTCKVLALHIGKSYIREKGLYDRLPIFGIPFHHWLLFII